MASNKDEEIQKIKPASNQEPNKKINIHEVSKNNFLLPLCILLALIAAITAAYTLYLYKQGYNQLINTHNAFSEEIKQLKQQQKDTEEQINEKTSSTEEAQTQLKNNFTHFKTEVQSAMSQRLYQNQDWLLLKARYYLELAQINAHWSTNSETTIALLQQADNLLKQFNEPQIFNIRQAIAKDIMQIQASTSVDSTGLLSQLDAAQQSVEELSIPLPINEENTTDEKITKTANPSSWNAGFKKSMNMLEQLVVIRRHDQNIKPLLSPELEMILKEKLQLNLQEAQWAVLNNNPFVYQLVLNQAIKNLKTHFNANGPHTAALIKKLTELQQIKLTQSKPKGDSALPLLNELIDSKKSQTIPKESGGTQS